MIKMALKDWKKAGTLDNGNWIRWETKKRSKVYRGQADRDLILQKHPMDESLWTVQHGQAPISMPKFKKKSQAMKFAKAYMKKH